MIDWVRSNKNLVIGVVIGMAVLVVGIVLFMQSNLFDRDAQVAEDIERYISEDGDITITSDLPEDDIIEVPEEIEDIFSMSRPELTDYYDRELEFSNEEEAIKMVAAYYWNEHNVTAGAYQGTTNEQDAKMSAARLDIYNYLKQQDVDIIQQVKDDIDLARETFDDDINWVVSHDVLSRFDFGKAVVNYDIRLSNLSGSDDLYVNDSQTKVGNLIVDRVSLNPYYNNTGKLSVYLRTEEGTYVSFKDLKNADLKLALNNSGLVEPHSTRTSPTMHQKRAFGDDGLEEYVQSKTIYSSNLPQLYSMFTQESNSLSEILNIDESLITEFKASLDEVGADSESWANILLDNSDDDTMIRNFSGEYENLEALHSIIEEYKEQLPSEIFVTITYNNDTVDIPLTQSN